MTSKQISVGQRAIDFSLPDHQGRVFNLADLYASQNVLLVFNLGFV